jgi:hypothetical protein
MPPLDYRAVLAAVNALGANQREHGIRLTSVEIKDLIIGRRNGL